MVWSWADGWMAVQLQDEVMKWPLMLSLRVPAASGFCDESVEILLNALGGVFEQFGVGFDKAVEVSNVAEDSSPELTVNVICSLFESQFEWGVSLGRLDST